MKNRWGILAHHCLGKSASVFVHAHCRAAHAGRARLVAVIEPQCPRLNRSSPRPGLGAAAALHLMLGTLRWAECPTRIRDDMCSFARRRATMNCCPACHSNPRGRHALPGAGHPCHSYPNRRGISSTRIFAWAFAWAFENLPGKRPALERPQM